MKILNLFQPAIAIASIGTAVVFTSNISEALTVEEVLNPRESNDGWVTDMADVLDRKTEKELNRLIGDLEQDDGTEIAVVTLPNTTPADSPKAFATELFNYWGIGKAKLDNGVLFLISVDENRVEIETGYGIQKKLSNAEVVSIIDNQIIPQYKQNEFNRGTLDGTKALIIAMDSSAVDRVEDRFLNLAQDWWLISILAIFVQIVFSKVFDKTSKNSSNYHSGGSDGGGFGGGSSGGDGGGGSW